MLDLRLAIPWYPPGSPCWVDLLVPDIARAQEFYTQLFGWQWRRADAMTGGYTVALLDGHPVAGISRKPPTATVDPLAMSATASAAVATTLSTKRPPQSSTTRPP
jgi:hypothetical protein